MAYRQVYFRIRTDCYNSGWTSDADRTAFEKESRPLVCLKSWQAVDGLFIILSAWEFESCVFLKTPKFGGFASPARYFYFTPLDFFNAE